MPNLNTSASEDKGASDNQVSALSTLQDKLSKHQTFHERVKAINVALRKAKINPADADAAERTKVVLREVLGDEQLVEMYLRQLWPLCRRQSLVKFPPSVLVKNGNAIKSLRASIEGVSR